MKWLKKFNESSYSVFDTESWRKLLPEKLSLITSSGNWELKLPDNNTGVGHPANISNLMNAIQIDYAQNTPEGERGNVVRDGEPDHLCIDIDIMKDNDGTHANPDSLKLNVSISYGDAMSAEFVIRKPNNVDVINYNGFGSKYDGETCFGFEDESIDGLINFFNSWGYQLGKKDFTFMDKYLNSYRPQNESIELRPEFDEKWIMIVNNSEEDGLYFNNIKRYLDFRGAKYKVANNSHEIQKINDEFNIIGTISTGSDYRISKDDGNGKENLKVLMTINVPHFMICYAFQSLGDVDVVGENIKGNYKLTKYDNDSPIFRGLDLETLQFSFDFNDKIVKCPIGFKVIAELDGIITAISNSEKKIYGTLFHPEDIEDTYKVLDNFLDICNQSPESKIDDLKGGNKVTNVIERYNQFISRFK